MSECCDPSIVPEVALGASVYLKAGPFTDSAGNAINFTSGWTITLTLQDPGGTESAALGTPTGSADGYLTCTIQADELDEVDVWSARFAALNGTTRRVSELFTFRVVDLLP